jgi:hypothetical protein
VAETNPSLAREDLVALCEEAVRPESAWHDRDSAGAHRQLGEAWALLKAGCDFHVIRSGSLATDAKTIWVEISYRGFNAFEYGSDHHEAETFYIPTAGRLSRAGSGDWY